MSEDPAASFKTWFFATCEPAFHKYWNALEEEGFDSFASFKLLSDEDLATMSSIQRGHRRYLLSLTLKLGVKADVVLGAQTLSEEQLEFYEQALEQLKDENKKLKAANAKLRQEYNESLDDNQQLLAVIDEVDARFGYQKRPEKDDTKGFEFKGKSLVILDALIQRLSAVK